MSNPWDKDPPPIGNRCQACSGPLDKGQFCNFCMARADRIRLCRKCMGNKRKRWDCDRCGNSGVPDPKGYIGYRVRKRLP